MENKSFTKEWVEYAKAWTKKNFDNRECLGCDKNDTLEQTKDYITRCIKDDYDQMMFVGYIAPTKEYSSEGMTELQEIVYLMEETGKILFPDNNERVASIIFDCYNIEHGTRGIREMLNNFIKWIDTNKMKTRHFSSNLIMATMILQETQKMLHDMGDHDTSIAGILKAEKINEPVKIIEKCREYVDWQDLDGKF